MVRKMRVRSGFTNAGISPSLLELRLWLWHPVAGNNCLNKGNVTTSKQSWPKMKVQPLIEFNAVSAQDALKTS